MTIHARLCGWRGAGGFIGGCIAQLLEQEPEVASAPGQRPDQHCDIWSDKPRNRA